MKFLRNFLIIVVIALVILIAIGAFVINQWTRGPLPQHDGEIVISTQTVDTGSQSLETTTLSDTVTIYRDEWGVPHIYASNPYDLFFAQGYTQAQDRWWHMEFSRHTGRGSIQELTGKNNSVMGTDLFIRKAGWRRAAEYDLANADPNMIEHLQAFSDGVNAYIFSRPASALAMEYNLLGITGVSIEIEPWSPIDTLVWSKAMSWQLSGNADFELYISELMGELGEEMFTDYAPTYPFGEKATIIFPEDIPITEDTLTASNGLQNDIAGIRGLQQDFAEAMPLFARGSGIGSNNWVVHGDQTESGMPLLANDPHLSIGMPSIWYEVGLHCEPIGEDCPFNVVGFTFPAAPGVIIGHNDNIAWGVTNVGWDTQDYYLITVNPDNELQYEWNGEWRDMEVVEETIRYGDGEPATTIQVRLTHLGPIMNDNLVDEDGNLSGFNNENPRALRWTAYEPSTLFESILQLNMASNWEEFRAAVSLWDTPSQNIIYADIEGNIGYQTPGRVPVRAEGHTGMLPVPGNTDEYEWKGFVPFDNLPRIFNPARGYIATANQALVPLEYYDQLRETLSDEFGEDSHYQFDYFWAYGYRGQRIVDLIESLAPHSFETFRTIHGDNEMTVAKELTPYLESLDMGSEELNEARDWMLDWDYQMHMDSPQAALFINFWSRLMINLYNDQLEGLGTASGTSQHMWSTVLLAEDPENIWWDLASTNAVETRDDILIMSFEEGYADVQEQLGENRDEWTWGELHTATFISNPLGLSGIGLIEDTVNYGPVPTSGGAAIINATSWRDLTNNDFTVRALPSMRMIVDMSDLTNSVTIHTTGQSGHPYSEHYSDMVDPWRNIEYKPMLWERSDVEANAVSVLTLQPE